MKITGSLPPELGLGAAKSAGQGQEVQAPAAASMLSAGQQPQVELLTGAGIRMLLGELTKMLDRQSGLVSELPPAVAAAAGAALTEQAADEVLPQGLAALIKSAKSGAESMTALAGRLEEAASLARAFPAGVPEGLRELATAVAARLSQQPASPAMAPQTATGPAVMSQAATGPGATGPAVMGPGVMQQTVMEPAAPTGGQGTGLPGQSVSGAASQAIPGGSGRQATAQAATGQAATLATTGPTIVAKMPVQAAAAQPAAGAAIEGETATAAGGQAAKEAAAAGAGTIATGGRQGTALAAEADGLAALTGEPARAAKGQGEEAPLIARLQQVLTEALPGRPSPLVRAALSQATAALTAYLPAGGEKAPTGRGQLSLQEGVALLKVADSQPWLKLPEATLRQAAATMHELAAAAPGQQAADTTGGQNVLVMTVPLYLGPDGKAYPAYIHISQEREGGGQSREASAVRDTWLRVCLATENIGLVDVVFHVWGDRQLSVRAIFSEQAAVEDFRRMVPEIREELAASTLTLTDISVVGTPVK